MWSSTLIYTVIIAAAVLLQAVIIVSGEAQNCTGDNVIKEEDGDFEINVYKDSKCTFKFQIPSDKNLYIVVKSFSLAPGDVAQVYSPAKEDQSSLVLQQRGMQSPFVVAVPANDTLVVISSKMRNSDDVGHVGGHFSVKVCSLEVREDNALVQAPMMAGKLSQSTLSCSYKYTGTSVGQTQVWSFQQMDLKKGDITFTESKKTLANFTDGTTHSEDLVFKSLTVDIEILMATSVKQTGFVAAYTSMKTAPTFVDLTKEMNITNPGYPSGFYANEDVRWKVTAPEGWGVQLVLDDLQFADTGDELLLVDGDSLYDRHIALISTASTFVTGSAFLSSSNVVWVQFKSGPTQQTNRGFKLSMTPKYISRAVFVKAGETAVFVVAEKANTTDIPETESIMLQLSVPEWQRVHLEFNDSLLYPMTTVRCYDGWHMAEDLSRQPLAVFSSNTAFYPVVANFHMMLVVIDGFFENGTTTLQRLTGLVKEQPASESYQIFTEQQGTLSLKSPNIAKASWIIQNSEFSNFTKRTVLYINQLVLPSNLNLLIHHGPAESDMVIAKFTSQTAKVSHFPVITAPEMRVEITSSNSSLEMDSMSASSVVFQAHYTIDDSCRGTMTPESDTRGIITSPHYPDQYPYNEMCFWTLKENKDYLYVSFLAFQVYSEHNFEVASHTSNTSKVYLTASGDALPDDLIIKHSDPITFKFSSMFNGNLDDLHVGQGVKVYYQSLSCGGNLTAKNGTMATPDYPNHVKQDLRCVWIIRVPQPSINDSVSVLKFRTKVNNTDNTANFSNSVTIRDGASFRAPPLTLNTSEDKETMSRSNVLWVEYVFQTSSNGNSTTGFAFQLVYNTYECPKSEQCKNGICMHADWKCNGYDDCGDHSDEDDCTCIKGKSGAVSVTVLVIAIVVTLVLAVLATIAAPTVYRKIRYRNYSEMRDFMAPVST